MTKMNGDKLKKMGIAFSIVFMVLLVPITISAQSVQIPIWVKGVASFWIEGNISDDEFGKAISFLIEQDIIQVETTSIDNFESQNKIEQLEFENTKLQVENNNLKNQNSQLQVKLNNQNSQITPLDSSDNLNNFKLYELLPTKNDLNSEWRIIKSVEDGKPTKNFYYENAGQTKYDKNVNTIKEYRMNVFLFSSESLANEKFKEKSYILKNQIGYWIGNEYTLLFPEGLILDTKDCTAITKDIDYTGDFEQTYGYCIVGKYIIYEEIKGYYPDMYNDFINMMNIAKEKIESKIS